MASKPITILITAAAGLSYPSFVKCLRHGKEKFRIIGTAPSKDAVGFAFVDKGYLVPPPDNKNYINQLLSVCFKEKVKILFPTAPKELIPIASNFDKFQKLGTIVPISPLKSLILSEDKYQFFNFCKKIDAPVPEFIKVSNYRELKEAIFRLGYPKNQICFKPITSSGTRGFRILLTEKDDQLNRLLREQPDSTFTSFDGISSILRRCKGFSDLLIMEYLPGDEYSVDILADQGKPLIIVPRIRMKIVLGASFVGQVVKQKDVIRYSKKIVSSLKLNGIVGIQFKMDKCNQPKILEVNPRIHGGIIGSAAAGANLIYLAVKNAIKENWTAPKINWGNKFIRYYDEVCQDKKGRFFRL